MTPLTGALLVGGASSRFGSPKALARFRGETLVERAHRLLTEACEEVLVVGKAGLQLPFPVLDDGAVGRAPAHGLTEALRLARHEVVVALPVDNPLVTPGALRALGEAGAVPSERIPLPGAYPRRLLAALEARVAAGELSLRGLNPATVELPPRLLADADTPEALAELERPGHALVVGGTGMLAGLTGALVARGHPVTSFSRRGLAPVAGSARDDQSRAQLSPVAVDYREARALTACLARAVNERGPIELAVCWVHTDGPEVPGLVAEALAPGARLVQVFGTRRWPLADVPLHVAYRQVLLGSVGGGWLTHEEIAAGVLAAVDADLPVHVVGGRDG